MAKRDGIMAFECILSVPQLFCRVRRMRISQEEAKPLGHAFWAQHAFMPLLIAAGFGAKEHCSHPASTALETLGPPRNVDRRNRGAHEASRSLSRGEISTPKLVRYGSNYQ